MIIGIFGDSFAEPVNELSWTEILKNKHNLTVKNYAKSCTTAFWSYRKLKFHITELDVIVFVLTEANRLYHSDEKYQNVCTLSTAQNQLKDNLLPLHERKIYEAAEQYHMFLLDYEFNMFVQDQLLKEITQLAQQHSKRLIIIPAFQSSTHCQTTFECALYDITTTELRTNFGDDYYRTEQFETRANHMSKENNDILALKVLNLINNTTDKVTLDHFVFTKYNNPELYWKI